MLVDLSEVPMLYQEELFEMQNEVSVKTLFNIKGARHGFVMNRN